MDKSNYTILVIDDEESIRTSLSEFLKDYEFNVDTAEDAEEALLMIEKRSYDVVIVDLRLPGMSGDTMISRAHKMDSSINFVIHTGSVEFTLPKELTDIGMTKDNIFIKPVANLKEICNYIEKAVSSQK